MKQPCPKCKSLNTYSDPPEMVACMMCGKRWPMNGQQPVVIKQIIGGKRIMEKSPSGKVGICINCEREKFIAGADGLCGTCHAAVKGLTPGNQAYKDILASVKLRLTDLSKSDGRIKKEKTKEAKPLKDTPTDKAMASLDAIIKQLTSDRNFHLSFAEKLNKAIEALQS